jgi:CheY-like chemotaxis protein
MCTILVVDDLPLSHRILGYTLKKNGHAVLSATNGQEALDHLAENPVALVIADIAMPGMDGFMLLRKIRANADYKNLPVIMLTASGQDQDRLIARAEGANGFLTKPASTLELLETINQVLQHH